MSLKTRLWLSIIKRFIADTCSWKALQRNLFSPGLLPLANLGEYLDPCCRLYVYKHNNHKTVNNVMIIAIAKLHIHIRIHIYIYIYIHILCM